MGLEDRLKKELDERARTLIGLDNKKSSDYFFDTITYIYLIAEENNLDGERYKNYFKKRILYYIELNKGGDKNE